MPRPSSGTAPLAPPHTNRPLSVLSQGGPDLVRRPAQPDDLHKPVQARGRVACVSACCGVSPIADLPTRMPASCTQCVQTLSCYLTPTPLPHCRPQIVQRHRAFPGSAAARGRRRHAAGRLPVLRPVAHQGEQEKGVANEWPCCAALLSCVPRCCRPEHQPWLACQPGPLIRFCSAPRSPPARWLDRSASKRAACPCSPSSPACAQSSAACSQARPPRWLSLARLPLCVSPAALASVRAAAPPLLPGQPAVESHPWRRASRAAQQLSGLSPAGSPAGSTAHPPLLCSACSACSERHHRRDRVPRAAGAEEEG